MIRFLDHGHDQGPSAFDFILAVTDIISYLLLDLKVDASPTATLVNNCPRKKLAIYICTYLDRNELNVSI